jgi:teichuronic acid biosynthesis glycosyltransferase TuaG
MPLVSIITPAWKAAAFLPATIRSVQEQTFSDWEMLIADDCSPDATREVISAASEADPRVRLVSMPVNGGPAAARNGAISAASGRFLAYLDADDMWLPKKLERQLTFMAETGTLLSFTGFRRFGSDGGEPGHFIAVPSTLTYHQLLRNTAIATSTAMVDRDQTGPITMRKAYYDDLVCWLEILRSGSVARGLNEDLMRYRVVSGSVSRNKLKSAKEVWKTYREIEGLGLVRSAVSFAGYASHALAKYRRF